MYSVLRARGCQLPASVLQLVKLVIIVFCRFGTAETTWEENIDLLSFQFFLVSITQDRNM